MLVNIYYHVRVRGVSPKPFPWTFIHKPQPNTSSCCLPNPRYMLPRNLEKRVSLMRSPPQIVLVQQQRTVSQLRDAEVNIVAHPIAHLPLIRQIERNSASIREDSKDGVMMNSKSEGFFLCGNDPIASAEDKQKPLMTPSSHARSLSPHRLQQDEPSQQRDLDDVFIPDMIVQNVPADGRPESPHQNALNTAAVTMAASSLMSAYILRSASKLKGQDAGGIPPCINESKKTPHDAAAACGLSLRSQCLNPEIDESKEATIELTVRSYRPGIDVVKEDSAWKCKNQESNDCELPGGVAPPVMDTCIQGIGSSNKESETGDTEALSVVNRGDFVSYVWRTDESANGSIRETVPCTTIPWELSEPPSQVLPQIPETLYDDGYSGASSTKMVPCKPEPPSKFLSQISPSDFEGRNSYQTGTQRKQEQSPPVPQPQQPKPVAAPLQQQPLQPLQPRQPVPPSMRPRGNVGRRTRVSDPSGDSVAIQQSDAREVRPHIQSGNLDAGENRAQGGARTRRASEAGKDSQCRGPGANTQQQPQPFVRLTAPLSTSTDNSNVVTSSTSFMPKLKTASPYPSGVSANRHVTRTKQMDGDWQGLPKMPARSPPSGVTYPSSCVSASIPMGASSAATTGRVSQSSNVSSESSPTRRSAVTSRGSSSHLDLFGAPKIPQTPNILMTQQPQRICRSQPHSGSGTGPCPLSPHSGSNAVAGPCPPSPYHKTPLSPASYDIESLLLSRSVASSLTSSSEALPKLMQALPRARNGGHLTRRGRAISCAGTGAASDK